MPYHFGKLRIRAKKWGMSQPVNNPKVLVLCSPVPWQPNCRFLTTKHVFKRSFLQGNHFLVVNFLGKNRGKSLQMMFIHISSRTYCEVSHLCLPSSRQAKLRLPLASWASWFPWVDTGHLDRSILQAYQNSVGTHAPLDDYWFLIFTFEGYVR